MNRPNSSSVGDLDNEPARRARASPELRLVTGEVSDAEYAAPDLERCLDQAARWISSADALLVTAGAGMGVDSGLPDFRGDEGFWKAYPPLARSGLHFADIANPMWFVEDPRLAWGFYGHRLNLYRRTTPHGGFEILLEWGRRLEGGLFVYTSNVDGQFQRAGVDPQRIVECHGSIHHLQCQEPCSDAVWSADNFTPDVDDANCRLEGPLPACPECGRIARPNIAMFGDSQWLPGRTWRQERSFAAWRAKFKRLVVLEVGAGAAIATVRRFGERQCAPLIRVNPDAALDVSDKRVCIPMGALAALEQLALSVRPFG